MRFSNNISFGLELIAHKKLNLEPFFNIQYKLAGVKYEIFWLVVDHMIIYNHLNDFQLVMNSNRIRHKQIS